VFAVLGEARRAVHLLSGLLELAYGELASAREQNASVGIAP